MPETHESIVILAEVQKYMNISEKQITDIVNQVLSVIAGGRQVPIETSARHVHLSQCDVERLFGVGHQLSPKRPLSQPGQYLCEERVNLVGVSGSFYNVAVLGPVRTETQVEISKTDSRTLGIKPPVRESGDIAGSPGIAIVGSKGLAYINTGVIVARNHIHMTSLDATRIGVKDKQLVSVKVNGCRPVTFHDVIVRVKDSYSLSMHIDFDESNAVGLKAEAVGDLIID